MNILLITTDQQRYDALGSNGNPLIQTPNLDRLAGEGINFSNHTTSCPVCTPARSTMLTGKYPRTHGAWHVGTKLDERHQGLSYWLREKGYRTGIFGKAHFEPALSGYVETLPPDRAYYGFDEFQITEENVIGPYLDWIRTEHPNHYRDALACHNEFSRPASYPPLPEFVQGYVNACYTSTLPENLHQTAWITDKFIEFLDKHDQTEAPFFAWVSYIDPHHPWTPPEPFASMYKPEDMPPPRMKEGEQAGRPNGYSYLENMPVSEYQRVCAAYYAMITHVDHHIGRLLEHLRASGKMDDTLILFTSDHGEYNGDHGLIRKQDFSRRAEIYDNILHVPMMMRLPGGQGAGTRCEEPTQHEDIVPTVLDMLNMQAPSLVQGQSMLSAVRQRPDRRKYAYIDQPLADGTSIAGIRNDNWKLIHHPHAGYILTDLSQDPDEYVNLAESAEHQERFAELKRELQDWCFHTPVYRTPRAVW